MTMKTALIFCRGQAITACQSVCPSQIFLIASGFCITAPIHLSCCVLGLVPIVFYLLSFVIGLETRAQLSSNLREFYASFISIFQPLYYLQNLLEFVMIPLYTLT